MDSKNFFFLLLLANIPVCLSEEEEEEEVHWEYYGENGQKSWCEISRFCCGSRQSPIGLYFTGHWLQATPFKLINYTKTPRVVEMTNNGHSAIVQFSSDVIPAISGGGLKNTYIFSSLHFHWGKNSDRGAEHTINGDAAPIEMHLVHYNSKFESLDDAVESGEKDALAVLGVMFETSNYGYNYNYAYDNEPNYDYNYNNHYRYKKYNNYNSYSAINKISQSLDSIRFNEQSTTVQPFTLRELLPRELNRFFRYFGSLTTPDCNEVVAWTVFVNPSFITEYQLQQFRRLYSTTKDEQPAKPLVDNFRQLQVRSRATFEAYKTW